MDKIKQFKSSIERLVKVWQSKIEFGDEELIAEDLRWLVDVFDKLFEEKNINDFININGRYKELHLFENLNTESFFKQLNFRTTEIEQLKIKYFEQSRLENNREMNNSIVKDIQYNVIDLYLDVLKRVFGYAVEKNLRKTQINLVFAIKKVFFKVMTFDSKGFNSYSLLKDFLDDSVLNVLNDNEIENAYPSKEFVYLVYFQIIISAYFDKFIDDRKATFIKFHLLNVWDKLRKSKREEYLTEYLKSISQKTISNVPFREIDIWEIARMMGKRNLEDPFLSSLESLEEKRRLVITQEDFKGFYEEYNTCLNLDLPAGVDPDSREYFVKIERDLALELFKFRELQSLILEILGLIFHFEGEEKVKQAYRILRKNEEFSNQRSFFPTNEFEIFTWLLLTRNLRFNISGRFYGSLAYKYLYDILCFLILNSLTIEFDIDRFKEAIDTYGVTEDMGSMNSIKAFVEEVLASIDKNSLIDESSHPELFSILRGISNCFGESLIDAEKKLHIPEYSFKSFRESVVSRYQEKSIIFRMKSEIQMEGKVSGISFLNNAGRNELILRKYFIPNFFIPLYGLSENVGQDLIEQEISQFEFNLFNDSNILPSRTLFRSNVDSEIQQLSLPSFILFKNSFPDYWLRGGISGKNPKSLQNKEDSIHSILRYSSFDRNPELIIFPKSSIHIEYKEIEDSEISEKVDKNIFWKFLDLSTDDKSRKEILENPPNFLNGETQLDEELKKYLWLRVSVSNSITIDPKYVLRFELDPYGQ